MAVAYGHATWGEIVAGWPSVVHAVATLLIVQVGSNAVNQGTDLVEDRVNRPYRALPRGVVSSSEALAVGHVLWFFAILRAATLGFAFGVFVTLIVAVSYSYSSPPLRLKASPWMGNIGIALARGVFGFLAAWSVFGPVSAPEPWIVGFVLWLFLLGAATAKDFGDEAGDRSAGVRTLVVAYGPAKAAWLSLPFALSPILVVPVMGRIGWIAVDVFAYLGASFLVVVFVRSLVLHQGSANRVLEAGKPWVRGYVALMGIMVMFAWRGFV